MKINFQTEIKDLKGDEILGGPILAADQLCGIALADKGASVETARDAYRLNGLMEQIATAKGEIEISDEEITLLKNMLDNAIKGKQASTFLVGRLYGLLEEE